MSNKTKEISGETVVENIVESIGKCLQVTKNREFFETAMQLMGARTLQEAKQRACLLTWVILFRRHGCQIPDNISIMLESQCLLIGTELRELKTMRENRRQLVINAALHITPSLFATNDNSRTWTFKQNSVGLENNAHSLVPIDQFETVQFMESQNAIMTSESQNVSDNENCLLNDEAEIVELVNFSSIANEDENNNVLVHDENMLNLTDKDDDVEYLANASAFVQTGETNHSPNDINIRNDLGEEVSKVYEEIIIDDDEDISIDDGDYENLVNLHDANNSIEDEIASNDDIVNHDENCLSDDIDEIFNMLSNDDINDETDASNKIVHSVDVLHVNQIRFNSYIDATRMNDCDEPRSSRDFGDDTSETDNLVDFTDSSKIIENDEISQIEKILGAYDNHETPQFDDLINSENYITNLDQQTDSPERIAHSLHHELYEENSFPCTSNAGGLTSEEDWGDTMSVVNLAIKDLKNSLRRDSREDDERLASVDEMSDVIDVAMHDLEEGLRNDENIEDEPGCAVLDYVYLNDIEPQPRHFINDEVILDSTDDELDEDNENINNLLFNSIKENDTQYVLPEISESELQAHIRAPDAAKAEDVTFHLQSDSNAVNVNSRNGNYDQSDSESSQNSESLLKDCDW